MCDYCLKEQNTLYATSYLKIIYFIWYTWQITGVIKVSVTVLLLYETTNYFHPHLCILLNGFRECLTIICHHRICHLFEDVNSESQYSSPPIDLNWLQNDKPNVSHKFILYQLSIVLFWLFPFLKILCLTCYMIIQT